jgi:hypothetical protein
MISGNIVFTIAVNACCDFIANGNKALDNLAEKNSYTIWQLLCVSNLNNTRRRCQNARVAHLPAAFGMKRRNVKNNCNIFTVITGFYGLRIVDFIQ